jgi:hypothetical protein
MMDALPAEPLAWLRTQMRKDGVGLGGLPWAQQRLVLAWVWAGLPQGVEWDERGLNALLQKQLQQQPPASDLKPDLQPGLQPGLQAGPAQAGSGAAPAEGAACWLRSDHVELRRWLVDAGLLLRDGYGRVYRAAAPQALPSAWSAALQQAAQACLALDTAAVVGAERAARRAERAQRQAAWRQQGQGA